MKKNSLLGYVFFSTLLVSNLSVAKPWLALDMNSWNTLKEMCENYRDFGAQVPPEDIQVKCEATTLRTQVVETQEIIFPGSGAVRMSITSSKANVSASLGSTPVEPTKVSCPVIAQVRQVAAGSFASSCKELREYNGSFVDFCVEKLRSGNYNGEAEVVHGTKKSLCIKKQ